MTEAMAERVRDFLAQKRIALLGATNKPDNWGYTIFRALKRLGYDVLPVHPTLADIDGAKVYRSLRDVPAPVDGVNLVVPPSATEGAVRDCRELGIRRVWMQPGAESEDAIEAADAAGLECIHHKCILTETGSLG